jgi:flagellar basal-body rod modification protein FlgD
MQISDIAASYLSSQATQQQTAAASSASSSMTSSNNFMMMLLAQLSNQNPLEPLKDSDMLSQFAQLNSVQELQSIQNLMNQVASANQTGYAASLIGKTITANLDNGKSLSGVVTGITMEAGQVFVHVGDQKALVSNIVEIKEK